MPKIIRRGQVGGGGSSIARAVDAFIVTSPANKVYSLGHITIDDLAEVHINGIIEKQDAAYTVSGSTVTLDNSLVITIGDKIDVWYNYIT